MSRGWLHYWPVFLMGAAVLAVGAFYVVAEQLTREPPNYTHIEPDLWIGGRVPAPPPGVRAVLNLCEAGDPFQAEVHRHEPIHDGAPAPTLDWLREQVAFIRTHRQAGRPVYVHCQNGVSRSALVVTAYLMDEHGWSREHALNQLATKRPVRPNPAFLKLLEEWEHRAS